MSNVNALYHIVFSTKYRKKTIPMDLKDDLFRYIWKEIDESKCHLYRINCMPDHLHMLINLHPSIALADLVKKIKAKSSGWMRSDLRFYDFESWGKGYFAATIAYNDRNSVIDYIKGQQVHHSIQSFDDEISRMAFDEGMTLYEDDLK